MQFNHADVIAQRTRLFGATSTDEKPPGLDLGNVEIAKIGDRHHCLSLILFTSNRIATATNDSLDRLSLAARDFGVNRIRTSGLRESGGIGSLCRPHKGMAQTMSFPVSPALTAA